MFAFPAKNAAVYCDGIVGKRGDAGRVCTIAPGNALISSWIAAGSAAGWSTRVTLCVAVASSNEGGGTDHIKSASSALGMKRCDEGLFARDVPFWKVKRR